MSFSNGVQLPKEIILELGLHEGDEITLSILPDRRTLLVVRVESPEELLTKLRAQRRRAPEGFQFERS